MATPSQSNSGTQMSSLSGQYQSKNSICMFAWWVRPLKCLHNQTQILLLLLPGAELALIAESFGLLNDLLLPFLSILDASCPISDLHLANVLFDVILPSVLGSSL